jgi:phage terminase Nu1 subunit (DNA packaging protein)
MSIDEMTVSDRDLAQLAGVSDRRIRAMAEAGILEKHGRGKYLLGPSIRALLNNAADNASELQRERTRKMAADADLAELEYARRKSLIAPVAQMQLALESIFALVRASMMNIPQRTALQIVGDTDEARIKRVLDDEIRAALTAMADAELGPDFFDTTTEETSDGK